MNTSLKKEITGLAKQIGRRIRFMEVCGTHTEAITKFGLRQWLPRNIELVSGPGCPVCVTPTRDIDVVIALAQAGLEIYCYGDVLRVLGTKMSLEQVRADGAKVRVVYSPEEILSAPTSVDLSRAVFFGIGFETTAPLSAVLIKKGVTVYSAHKFFPPAMRQLAALPNIKIDGFINPGHVSAIIGTRPYLTIKKPQVIAGFEPADILVAILLLLRQILSGRTDVENEYARLVRPSGNRRAQSLLQEVFAPGPANWRGLGEIPDSGMQIRSKFKKFDATKKFARIIRSLPKSVDPKGCRCGDILTGQLKPNQCSLFGKLCLPKNPQGACMVSREGACRIAYEK
jgi:hydrogenase expression/formation protein HypD